MTTMLLTYRVEGDVLVTDQPSDPREERTKFKFTASGNLVLLREQRPATYVRIADEEPLPLPGYGLN